MTPTDPFPFRQHRTMARVIDGERSRWVGHAGPAKRPPRADSRRLTPEQVARIREPGAKPSALAREFGVSGAAVHYVRHRYSYKELP